MKDETRRKCAESMKGTIPIVMRTIGSELIKTHSSDISLHQFRAMLFIRHNSGASLSMVAEFLGLALPTASKLIDELVELRHVARRSDEVDRRRIILTLTGQGDTALELMDSEATALMEQKLAPLTIEECRTIISAMDILRNVVAPAMSGQDDTMTIPGGRKK